MIRLPTPNSESSQKPGEQSAPRRMMLWVDAVGGFLVCRGPRVTIGQAQPHDQADIPVLGQLSRRHATFRLDGESFLVEPRRPLLLDGRPVTGASAVLGNGMVLEFAEQSGPTHVKFRFRQPHPLARSAGLEPLSGHRTQPPADGVLLWTDTLVFGPSSRCHIVCPQMTVEVVLFARAGEVFVKAPGGANVDGSSVAGRAALGPTSRVATGELSFTLEPLGS